MAASKKEVVQALHEDLEQRGARAVSISGHLDPRAFGPEGDQRRARVGVEFDGDPEMVRHAVNEMDGVVLDGQPSTEQWPGGDLHVEAEIAILDGGSAGGNPGGNVDVSPSSPPVHPNSRSTHVPTPMDEWAEQGHVPVGGTWGIEDETGITDEREVEVWPVRSWEPAPRVPAMTVLRYVPHPSAYGMEWWAGYARLVPEGEQPPTPDAPAPIAAQRIEYEGHRVPIGYGPDDAGWVGWVETEMPVDFSGVPVVSTVPEDSMGQMSNHDAAAVTERLAQAIRRVRADRW